ncbi:MAG: hypothetical protein EHM48_01025 [Planctomycetaceae bacterium]|nr:MAG: hypothetical protein EHM48_01025 [Planctomycetaceae bacterium]
MNSKLTSTRLSSMRRCLRLHYYRYEMGLSRMKSATALRFGGAFHAGLEAHNRGASDATVMECALADYATIPQWADQTDWAVECATLKTLISGHIWRYGQDHIEIVAVEKSFDIPLVNPATGARSRLFTLAGKMDGIVKLSDGRLAVLEYKTAGEDIGPDGDYWQRLRCDGQISQYVLAARAMGYDVATVIYDVTRKPSIRLRQNETPEAYGQRLLEDIGARPDFYFQRREVPRLEDELGQYRSELWQQAQQLIELRRRALHLNDPSRAHFRNVSKMTCGQCEFADICLSSARVDPASPPPGFQILQDIHPELT